MTLPFQPSLVCRRPGRALSLSSCWVDDSTTHGKGIIADVRRQVQWLFVDKGEANPWGYAKYHCTTGANVYNNVHWGWVSNPDNTPT